MFTTTRTGIFCDFCRMDVCGFRQQANNHNECQQQREKPLHFHNDPPIRITAPNKKGRNNTYYSTDTL